MPTPNEGLDPRDVLELHDSLLDPDAIVPQADIRSRRNDTNRRLAALQLPMTDSQRENAQVTAD